MDQHSQEEAVIVERFRRFQPRPSRKVYERMVNMPWGKPIERKPIMQTFLPSPRTKTAVAALVIAVLAGTAIWTTPAFRAFAQELLNTLFNRESSSTIVVAPISSSTGDAGLTATLS